MIYADVARRPGKVGNVSGRWSRLTADTSAELVQFADAAGIDRRWYLPRCRLTDCPTIRGVCAHFHYHVDDAGVNTALDAGADPIDTATYIAVVKARHPQFRTGATRA